MWGVIWGVTFQYRKKLILTNDLKVTGGTLTFEDSASLIQINNVLIQVIRYRRATQGAISNFDYTYWSSPVSPQTLFNVSPSTLGDKFYSFNGVTDNWVQQNHQLSWVKVLVILLRTVLRPNHTLSSHFYWCSLMELSYSTPLSTFSR
jgi:hypothetical protein